MLFDALTPDTSAYMIAGYVLFFLITAIYLVSLFVRTRNLNRDLLTLETLQEEQKVETAAPQPAPSRPKASRTKSSKAKKPQKKTARKR